MSDSAPSPFTTLSKLTFEEVGSAHCQILAALHETSFEKPWGPAEFAQMLDQPGTCGLIALIKETAPLGFILLRSVIDEAEILTFCVDPRYRNQKIATRILNSVVATYKTQGIDKIFLEVAEDNVAAISLYKNCGFNTVGNRPGYYRKHGKLALNAIIMAHFV